MKKNIIKVKKIQKPLICLLVIFAILFGIAVGKFMNTNADEINYEYESDNIGYDSTNNSLNATNVKDAIDELYEKLYEEAVQCQKGYKCTKLLVAIKKYDETSGSSTYCVNGDEITCVEEICIENGIVCPAGTIVDYNVNDGATVRFHVLHDNGETLTMLTQENIIHGIEWNVSGSINGGPITIMAALKNTTSWWSNVKDITFTDGMTTYAEDNVSAINRCDSYNSCSGNQYQYSTIVNVIGNNGVMKARLLIMQEAYGNSGCTDSIGSCKKFMYNYIRECSLYGCTIESNSARDYGYWTMGVAVRYVGTYAWLIDSYGRVNTGDFDNKYNGARAVVVVDK